MPEPQTFEEWWTQSMPPVGWPPEHVASLKLWTACAWTAAQAAQRERDARIAEGLRMSFPAVSVECGETKHQIAEAIRRGEAS